MECQGLLFVFEQLKQGVQGMLAVSQDFSMNALESFLKIVYIFIEQTNGDLKQSGSQNKKRGHASAAA